MAFNPKKPKWSEFYIEIVLKDQYPLQPGASARVVGCPFRPRYLCEKWGT